MKYFKNALILTENEGLKRKNLAFGRRIEGFTAGDEEIALPEGAVVLPGFIDEHVHGAGGADTMDASVHALGVMAETLTKEGTTSFLATTMTQSHENTLSALRAANEYLTRNPSAGARLLGIHTEGPFLSRKHCGAQPEEYIVAPSVPLFEEFDRASGGHIRLVTLAPEEAGAETLIRHLRARGIAVSIGHSDARYDDVSRAIACGARCVTHTFNAQRGVHHREIGVAGSALLQKSLFAEVIADGIHVSVPALSLLAKNKGRGKLILITDAMRAKGLGDGKSELGGQTVEVKDGEARLRDGTLAGSVLLMNVAVKNMVERVGLPLERAVRCASLNPARHLKIDGDFGSIAPNKYADFVALDSNFNVIMTIRGGETVYRR